MAQNRHVRAKLCVGGRDIGINPKVNNLNQGFEQSVGELVWICDAGIRADPNTLSDLVFHFSSEKVGMVHALPISCGTDGTLPALLEKVRFPRFLMFFL